MRLADNFREEGGDVSTLEQAVESECNVFEQEDKQLRSVVHSTKCEIGSLPEVMGSYWYSKRARGICGCFFLWLSIGLLLLYGGLFGLFSPGISFFCRRWSVESEKQAGCRSDRWASRARVDNAGRNVTRIVLIGDSMISQPNAEFDFLFRFKARLASRFRSHSFDLVEAGVGLDTISNIAKRLQEDCLSYSPDAVFIYTDSDVSEIEQCDDSAVKRAYSESLSSVLRSVASVTPRIAVLGPSVLGELADGHNLAPWHKDTCLNHYSELNRIAVQQLQDQTSAVYVNTRQRFLSRLRAFASGAGYVFPSGYLTIDGDHHSRKGSDIIMDAMFQVAERWYSAGR